MIDRRRLLAAFAALTAKASAAMGTGGGAAVDLTLRSPLLEVRFDAARGVPLRYAIAGDVLSGAAAGDAVQAILCRLTPRTYSTLAVRTGAPSRAGDTLTFPCRIEQAGRRVAAFDLRYAIKDASLVLGLENVVEQPGFELIEVALPDLVSVAQDQPEAWFAEGREGGSFVRLAAAKPVTLPDDPYFGRISTQMPVGMVGTARIGCVMEVSAYMDGTETAITGTPGALRATLGTIQTHRVHGGRCYNMNDAGPMLCGTADTPNLIVGQTPRTRLDFFRCESARQPWLPGALILRDRAPTAPSGYYAGKLVYMIHGKIKTEAAPRTSFAQSADLIRDIALLTDHVSQIGFVSGWVYDGQDTGYPSEDKVNASLGTYDELKRLMAGGRRWNANIALNVNYDDAYKSSPIFDPAFIARRPDGKLWTSRAWAGEMSYITGMAKFVKGGWARRRLKAMVERYPIRDALLIDALSWYAIRNDWDRAQPASGYANLIDGRFAVIREAKTHGLVVCSENFRYPMIGTLAMSVNGPLESTLPFGGAPIPLTAIVYRHSAIWGNAGEGGFEPGPDLMANCRPANWFRASSERMQIAEAYFLVTLPHAKLHDLRVTDYAVDGDVRRLALADRSSITLGGDPERYSATWRGTPIAQDGATFCPIDEDRIAFYAKTARTLRYPLPTGWHAATVTARALSLAGASDFPLRIVGAMIEVSVPARQPVIVYRDRSAASAPRPMIGDRLSDS